MTRSSCRRNLDDRVDSGRILENLWRYDYSRSQGSPMESTSRDRVKNMLWSYKTGQLSGVKVIHVKPNHIKKRREVCDACEEWEPRKIYSTQNRNSRRSCTPSQGGNVICTCSVWTSRRFGAQKPRSVIASSEMCKTFPADGQTPYERGFNSLLMRPSFHVVPK